MNLGLKNKNFINRLFIGEKIILDIRDGFGLQLLLNGDIYIGRWKNNNFDKKGLFIYDDIIIEGEYNEGILENGKIQINDYIAAEAIFFEKLGQINFFSVKFIIEDGYILDIGYMNNNEIDFIQLNVKNEVNIYFKWNPINIICSKIVDGCKYDENSFSFTGIDLKIKIFKDGTIKIKKINEIGEKYGQAIIFKNIFEIEKINYLNDKIISRKVINKNKGFTKFYENKNNEEILLKIDEHQNGFQLELNESELYEFSLKYFPGIFFDKIFINKNIIHHIIDFGLRNIGLNTNIMFFELSEREEIFGFYDIRQSKVFLMKILYMSDFFSKVIYDNPKKIKYIEDFMNKDEYCGFFKEDFKIYGLFGDETDNSSNIIQITNNSNIVNSNEITSDNILNNTNQLSSNEKLSNTSQLFFDKKKNTTEQLFSGDKLKSSNQFNFKNKNIEKKLNKINTLNADEQLDYEINNYLKEKLIKKNKLYSEIELNSKIHEPLKDKNKIYSDLKFNNFNKKYLKKKFNNKNLIIIDKEKSKKNQINLDLLKNVNYNNNSKNIQRLRKNNDKDNKVDFELEKFSEIPMDTNEIIIEDLCSGKNIKNKKNIYNKEILNNNEKIRFLLRMKKIQIKT